MDKSGERLHMLQRKNQQLSAELAVLRQENQELEKSIADLRDKQTEYTDTLVGVDRLWKQLNNDMAYIGQRIRGFSADGATEQPVQQQSELQNGDPFLQRLIHSEHVDAAAVQKRLEELADDATDAEKALAPRSAGTLQAFATLLELYDVEVGKYRAAVEQVAQGHNPDLQQEIQKLHSDAANFRRELDAQKGVSRTAEAQLRQLTDMLQKDERAMQDLNNELADKKEELNAANRKLHTLKSSSDALPNLSSQSSLPLPLVRRRSPSPSPKDSEASEALQIAEKELKTERERADSLAKQLRAAQAKMQDESFVTQAAVYQVVQQQLQAQTAELDKARKIMEGLQRECEGYKHSIQGLVQQAEDARHQRRMVHLTEERVQELENKLATARTLQEAAELNLQKEKEKAGNGQTVRELQSMTEVLEKEVQTMRGNASKRQGLLADVEAARKSSRAALAKLEAKETELTQMSEKMSGCEASLTSLQAREKDIQAAADDLRVFVEVLQSFCDDPRDLAEVRASEARLKNQLFAAQKQLKGHELQAALDKAQESESQAKAQLGTLQQERTALQLEVADLRRQSADQQQQCSALTADIDAYTTEMEVIGAAYEDMQGKNSRLLQQLTKRDETNNQLLTERIQSQHSATRLIEEKASAKAARKLAEQQVAALQERVAALEARLQENTHELGQTREQATLLAQQVEGLGAEVREREAALRQREPLLAAAQAAADARQQALDEEAEKLQRERSRRQRLEEENKVLQSKVEKLSSHAGAAVNEELEGMRLMMRCRVCRVRTKDTVITKCWHTFCSECIKRNLDARNRKCPACGHLFGAQDVKQIYL